MRIKINCHIAGEAFNYDAGTVVDWPDEGEAARYCVLGRANPVGDDDKPVPVVGELADRLWMQSGLRRPKQALRAVAPETAALQPAVETAALPQSTKRKPGRPAKQTVPPDEDDDALSDE